MAFLFFWGSWDEMLAFSQFLQVHCSVSTEHKGLNTCSPTLLCTTKLQINLKIKILRPKPL
jgi:hypothetical protein